MAETKTIPKAPLPYTGQDYAQLRAEGLGHIRRLAGDTWTDHNLHDPGITILEHLCYAITDLCYRMGYSVPDLLASEGGDTGESLYSPAQVLTGSPITLNDWRKVIIDTEGVKNAWIETVTSTDPEVYFNTTTQTLVEDPTHEDDEPLVIRGLYQVLIQKSDTTALSGSDIQDAVKTKLYALRSLGEDFDQISIMESQSIQVQAEIEIGDIEDPAQLLAEICAELSRYISPGIPFYTLAEMEEKDKTIDQIFEGPVLEHGFICDEDLEESDRREYLYTSDLIRIITPCDGVKAIKDIFFVTDDGSEKWSLELDRDRSPVLDISFQAAGSGIVLYKETLAVAIDADDFTAKYEVLNETTEKSGLEANEKDVIAKTGKDRSPGSYHSLQNLFPVNYGIGEWGLPASSSTERKAQALQLQGYLSFFEQVMANHLSQLSNVKNLFSFHQDDPTTYYSQPLTEVPGISDILNADPEGETWAVTLQEMTETEEAGLFRKNRFLNHLLARFGEQFADYALTLHSMASQDVSSLNEVLASAKRSFLQDYPTLGHERGQGFDYSEGVWDTDNVSGLEKRICKLTGLDYQKKYLAGEDDAEGFHIIEHILLRQTDGTWFENSGILSSLDLEDPFSFRLSFVLPNWGEKFSDEAFIKLMEKKILEETPAHFKIYIHWLDQTEMAAFESEMDEWLEQLQNSV